MSQLERAERRITVEDLVDLCAALKVPLWQLLVGAAPGCLEALGLPVPNG